MTCRGLFSEAKRFKNIEYRFRNPDIEYRNILNFVIRNSLFDIRYSFFQFKILTGQDSKGLIYDIVAFYPSVQQRYNPVRPVHYPAVMGGKQECYPGLMVELLHQA